MPCLLVVPESFAPNDIALVFEEREVTSTVCLFYLVIKAAAVVSVLDHSLVSLMYTLSDGATFFGNRLDEYETPSLFPENLALSDRCRSSG